MTGTTTATATAISGGDTPSSFLQCFQENNDTRREILSHLTLTEIQDSFRGICKATRSLGDDYKAFVVGQISARREVLLVDLQSDRGKLLNGQIGRCLSVPGGAAGRNGQYPIQLDDLNWISGESVTKHINLRNLHVLFRQQDRSRQQRPIPSSFVEYTSTSRVLESHGRLLRLILLFARWHANIHQSVNISDLGFHGDFDDFQRLPWGHIVNISLDAHMFDYWRTKPFRSLRPGRNRESVSALDFIAGNFRLNYDDLNEASIERAAVGGKIWPADGPRGQNMIRNVLQCMKSWKEEHVRGGFWITDTYKTGTVMVSLLDLDDPNSLSTVYLVKGHGDIIGELAERSGPLPRFCRTTLLPLYDFWTYSGIITLDKHSVSDCGDGFEQRLRQHVEDATYSYNVSWRGPSAKDGLWNFETSVPKLPTFLEVDGEFVVSNWNDGIPVSTGNEDDCALTFGEEEWEITREIARKASALGGTRKLDDDQRNGSQRDFSALTFRRLGYSYDANPNGICTVMDSRTESISPIHTFTFNVDHENQTAIPSYALTDVLKAILAAMNKAAPHPLVTHIMPDDRDILAPLDKILVDAFEKEGLVAPYVDNYG